MCIRDSIEIDLMNNFKRLGVRAKLLNGKERLHLMHDMFQDVYKRQDLQQDSGNVYAGANQRRGPQKEHWKRKTAGR